MQSQFHNELASQADPIAFLVSIGYAEWVAIRIVKMHGLSN